MENLFYRIVSEHDLRHKKIRTRIISIVSKPIKVVAVFVIIVVVVFVKKT